jgi:hypothetical protein
MKCPYLQIRNEDQMKKRLSCSKLISLFILFGIHQIAAANLGECIAADSGGVKRWGWLETISPTWVLPKFYVTPIVG